ncbi:hypothetical protein ACU686_03615 [Yinghuangia aomiensis]
MLAQRIKTPCSGGGFLRRLQQGPPRRRWHGTRPGRRCGSRPRGGERGPGGRGICPLDDPRHAHDLARRFRQRGSAGGLLLAAQALCRTAQLRCGNWQIPGA